MIHVAKNIESNFNWHTTSGRVLKRSEITHQHLSNIFWYYLLLHEEYSTWIIEDIKAKYK